MTVSASDFMLDVESLAMQERIIKTGVRCSGRGTREKRARCRQRKVITVDGAWKPDAAGSLVW